MPIGLAATSSRGSVGPSLQRRRRRPGSRLVGPAAPPPDEQAASGGPEWREVYVVQEKEMVCIVWLDVID